MNAREFERLDSVRIFVAGNVRRIRSNLVFRSGHFPIDRPALPVAFRDIVCHFRRDIRGKYRPCSRCSYRRSFLTVVAQSVQHICFYWDFD
jgi:hypothetical protein